MAVSVNPPMVSELPATNALKVKADVCAVAVVPIVVVAVGATIDVD